MKDFKIHTKGFIWAVARLSKATAEAFDGIDRDELIIMEASQTEEGFGYTPPTDIALHGNEIIELRDFLNEHYPRKEPKQ